VLTGFKAVGTVSDKSQKRSTLIKIEQTNAKCVIFPINGAIFLMTTASTTTDILAGFPGVQKIQTRHIGTIVTLKCEGKLF
jgi:hypothetical protein